MNELIENKNNILKLKTGEEVEFPFPVAKVIEVAYKSIAGELIDASDIAKYLNVSIYEAMKLMTHQVFAQMTHQLALAQARHGFDAIAFNKLMYIAQHSEAERLQIQAIKTLADIMGLNESKKKNPVNININMDSLVRGNNETPFPGF